MRHEPLQATDSPARPRVLVVDRAPERAAETIGALDAAGFFAVHQPEASPQELVDAVAQGWDVVVTSEDEAGNARASVRDCDADVPVVVVRSRESDIAADVRNAVVEANARRERRRIADRLHQSEMRLRAVIEGSFDAFFVFDREVDEDGASEYRLVEVNERGASLLAGSKDDVVGKRFSEIAKGDRLEYFVDRFSRVFDSGLPLEEEYEVQAPDLFQRWLNLQIVPLLTGVAVTARDITERKRNETALRESEERFQNIVRHVPGVFFTIVPDEEHTGNMQFDFVSDGIETLTGHRADEFFGPNRITLKSRLHPDDQRLIDDMDERLFAGASFAIDVRIVRPDDSVSWAHLKADPTTDEAGSIVAGHGVMLDITGRKAAEEALHLRERAIDALAQGVVITDATLPGKPIVYVNRAYEQLTGFTAEELIGRPATALAPVVDAATQPVLDAAFNTDRPSAHEFECGRKDGSTFWCAMLISPIEDEQGLVTHFLSISADETTRKRLEDQVLQAHKMEAVGRLAGGIAHDFNNVLLVIRGYSHVLMSLMGEGRDGWEEAKEIETAATRASDLIRHLLAFSRRQVMQTQVVDLNGTLEGMRDLLEAVLGAGITLRTALDEDLGAVSADPVLLEQTIVNLVLNARDAMPQGGTLWISTGNVVVDASLPDAPQLVPGVYSKLTLEDTGTGMDAETLARVFEPFFSTKTDTRGTGLGLPTAYGFVKQSGGEITITSAPGEGTAVRIYLPHAAEIVATPVTPAEQPRVPSAVETVLLVEDDHNARTLVGRILRESGYDVHEAALPSEALSFCEQYERQIHLLVSDVVMPEMSGPSVAKRILEMRPDTRVLFVSGYIDSADDVDIVSSGAAFLQKPFTPSELLSAVRRVLDDREAVSA